MRGEDIGGCDGPASAPGAVLLDALGTLLRLEPPGPPLAAELRGAGFDVSDDRAAHALPAEIRFYLAHHLEGRDPEGLERLRDRCAAVLAEALGVPGLDAAIVRPAMLAALRFTAYPDAARALADLRSRGLALAVVSNWDCSLPRVLDDAGLLELVDVVVPSAVVGAAKPDPVPFRAALAALGTPAAGAVHVGDSPDADVAGARAAGLRAVLLDRTARAGSLEAGRIGSLSELRDLPGG
jgi:putative hydrolase of the HAD superfamily